MRKINFTSGQKSANFCNAFAKSEAEPENSNLYKANSTPKACFFVRNIRTPKERPELLESPERQSMVACNGKGFALCCIPCIAVSQPVTRYRPKPENLQAVALINQIQGLSEMIYKFLLLGKKRLTIRILANSEAEARQRLQLTSPALCVARFKSNGGFMRNSTPVQKNRLHPLAFFSYPSNAFAKSEASREKLNDLLMANSTPNRAFFVRNFRTPKINPVMDLFSMVGRNRQPLAVGCVPLVAVSHPVTSYRPTVRSLAVVPKKLLMELSEMIYKFLLLGKKRLTIRILANSEAEARQRLQFTSPALCVARFKSNGGIYA